MDLSHFSGTVVKQIMFFFCQIQFFQVGRAQKKRGIIARHQRKEELLPDIPNQLKSINLMKSDINQLILIFC